MKVRVVLTAIVSAMALGVLGVTSASADPSKASVLQLDCDALGAVQVGVFGNGSPSPALVSGQTQVLVPYRLELEGTFTPVGGGEPETFSDSFSKPAPNNGRLDHCTFHQEESEDFGSIVLDGDVWISYTPAR